MPNCFQLIREGRAVKLHTVDEEMCKHFGEPCDPDKWYHHWYQIIGFALATGKSFDDQIAEAPSEMDEWQKRHLEILLWMRENFDYDCWVQTGKS